MGIKKGDTGQLLNQQFEEEEKLIDREVVGMAEVSPELKASMRANIGERIEEMKRESIYAQLSDDDLEALELGKKIQQILSEESDNTESAYQAEEDKENEAVRALSEEILGGFSKVSQKNATDAEPVRGRRSRKKEPVKALVGLAATLVLVIAMGTVSLGGPKSVIEIVKQIIGGREVVKVNSADNVAKTDMDLEEEAYQQVYDEFRVEPVRISYRPENMKFKSIEFDELLQTADMLYNNDGNNVHYLIGAGYRKSAFSFEMDDKKSDFWTEKIQGCKIEITEYTSSSGGQKRYTAEFEFRNIPYFLTGSMEKEEMQLIIQNLHFTK